MRRAFGYVRVSLEEEDPENQAMAIREFAERSGLDLLKIYMDVGVSGGEPAFERPEFTRMLSVARELGVDTIVFYDLTRLGRDIFDVIRTMQELLNSGYNVYFVKHPELNISQDDSLVAQTMRKAMLAMLAAFAEMERSFIRERTKQGMRRAKAQGRHVGRPPIPFPEEKVQALLKQGKTIADTWRLLRMTGEICREITHGKRDRECMSYETFRRKVKKLRQNKKT